jgi:hypothetical protein
MKRFGIIFFMLLFCIPQLAGAQKKKEDIEALRVTIFTKTIGLTTAEAGKFWPLYNQYLDKKETLWKNHQELRKTKYKNIDQLNEAKTMEMIEGELEFKQKELDLQKQLVNQLKPVLSSKKIALVFKAEEDFRKELVRLLKEKN